jgi:hypothetical protein
MEGVSMATNEEYQALIDSLSGECERLHKENEELKKALENHDTFMKYAYSYGKADALSQEPISPCDVCKYNPPSSMDGKPCTMCPAEGREE